MKKLLSVCIVLLFCSACSQQRMSSALADAPPWETETRAKTTAQQSEARAKIDLDKIDNDRSYNPHANDADNGRSCYGGYGYGGYGCGNGYRYYHSHWNHPKYFCSGGFCR